MKSLITDGFLVVDKSAGMTSHDVVALARRALGTRKVGHAGTLDPMATGVLVMGFGSGTRLLQYVTSGDKSYSGTIVLGSSTITDDAEGEVIAVATREQIEAIADEQITEVLLAMRGTIAQRPSSVSAVKVNGERSYARVRAGEEVHLADKQVTISALEIKAIRRGKQSIECDIDVTCSAGTFIRAIARDCGIALGVGGHLRALRRTRVANFVLAQAITVEELKAKEFAVTTVAEVAAQTFPIRELTSEEAKEISFGRTLSSVASNDLTAALFHDRLVALLRNGDGRARPIAVFTSQ